MGTAMPHSIHMRFLTIFHLLLGISPTLKQMHMDLSCWMIRPLGQEMCALYTPNQALMSYQCYPTYKNIMTTRYTRTRRRQTSNLVTTWSSTGKLPGHSWNICALAQFYSQLNANWHFCFWINNGKDTYRRIVLSDTTSPNA